jgi:P-type conjugative transfer protein TrbJ
MTQNLKIFELLTDGLRNAIIVGAKSRYFIFAVTFAFGATSFVSPPPAHAQWVVECVNCSTVFSQAMQYAKEVETAINTAQQLQTQIQQYQNMVTQGLSLPSSMFNRITGDFQRIQSLYQQSKSLAGNMTDFDSRFRSQFGDYNRYLSQVGQSPTYMADNYKRWSEQGLDSMRVAMQSAGMNVGAITSEDAMLSQLVARSQNAQGRMQAIQAGNEIAAQQVQQMQKLRQMLNSQIQSQSMWYAQSIQRHTVDDAFRQSFYSTTPQRGGAKDY